MQFLHRIAKSPQVLEGLDAICALLITERKVHMMTKNAAKVGCSSSPRPMVSHDLDLSCVTFQSHVPLLEQATSDLFNWPLSGF